jgi:hypothetical protein
VTKLKAGWYLEGGRIFTSNIKLFRYDGKLIRYIGYEHLNANHIYVGTFTSVPELVPSRWVYYKSIDDISQAMFRSCRTLTALYHILLHGIQDLL